MVILNSSTLLSSISQSSFNPTKLYLKASKITLLPWKIEAQDLVIFDNKNFDSSSIRIEELLIKPELFAEISTKLNLGEIYLKNAHIDLWQNAKGQFLWDFLNSSDPATAEPAQPPVLDEAANSEQLNQGNGDAAPSNFEIIIAKLQIENTYLRFHLDSDPFGIELKNLNLSLADFSSKKSSIIKIASYINYYQGEVNPETGNNSLYVRGDYNGKIDLHYNAELGQLKTYVHTKVNPFDASFLGKPLENTELTLNFLTDLKRNQYRWDFGQLKWGDGNDLRVWGKVDANSEDKFVETVAGYKTNDLNGLLNVFNISMPAKIKPELFGVIRYNIANNGVYIDWLNARLNNSNYNLKAYINELGGPKPIGFMLDLQGADQVPNQQLRSFKISQYNVNQKVQINTAASGDLEEFQISLKNLQLGKTKLSFYSKNSVKNNNLKADFRLLLDSADINELLRIAKQEPWPGYKKANLEITGLLNTGAQDIAINKLLFSANDKELKLNGRVQGWEKLASSDINLNFKSGKPFAQLDLAVKGADGIHKINGKLKGDLGQAAINVQYSGFPTMHKYKADFNITTPEKAYWPANLQVSKDGTPKIAGNINGDSKQASLNSVLTWGDTKISLQQVMLNWQKKIIIARGLADISNIDLAELMPSSNNLAASTPIKTNAKASAPAPSANATKAAEKIDLKSITVQELMPEAVLSALNSVDLDFKVTGQDIKYNKQIVDNFTGVLTSTPNLHESLILNAQLEGAKFDLAQKLSLDGMNKSSLDINLDLPDLNVLDASNTSSGTLAFKLALTSHGKLIADHIKSAKLLISSNGNLQKTADSLNASYGLKAQAEDGIFTLNIPFLELVQKQNSFNAQDFLLEANLNALAKNKIELSEISLASISAIQKNSATEVNSAEAPNAVTANAENTVQPSSSPDSEYKLLPRINLNNFPVISLSELALTDFGLITIIDASANSKQEFKLKPFSIDLESLATESKYKINAHYSMSKLDQELNAPSTSLSLAVNGKVTFNQPNSFIALNQKALGNIDSTKTEIDGTELESNLNLSWATKDGLLKLSNLDAIWQKNKAQVAFTLDERAAKLKSDGQISLNIPDYNQLLPFYNKNKIPNTFPVVADLKWNSLGQKFELKSNQITLGTGQAELSAQNSEAQGLTGLQLNAHDFAPSLQQILLVHGYKMERAEHIAPIDLNFSARPNLKIVSSSSLTGNSLSLGLGAMSKSDKGKAEEQRAELRAIFGDNDLKLSSQLANLNKPSAIPEIVVDLNTKYLNLDDFTISPINKNAAAKPEKTPESEAPLKDQVAKAYTNINDEVLFSAADFPKLNLTANAQVAKLIWHEQTAYNSTFSVKYSPAKLDQLAFRTSFNSDNTKPIVLQANFDANKPKSTLHADFSALDQNSSLLSKFITGHENLRGDLSLSLKSSSLGNTSRSIISNLRADVKLSSPQLHLPTADISHYSCAGTNVLRGSWFSDEPPSSALSKLNVSLKVLDGVATLGPDFNIQVTSSAVNSGRGYFNLNNGEVNLSVNASLTSSAEFPACYTPIFTETQVVNLDCRGNISEQEITDVCKPRLGDLAIAASTPISSVLNPLEWARRTWKYLID